MMNSIDDECDPYRLKVFKYFIFLSIYIYKAFTYIYIL